MLRRQPVFVLIATCALAVLGCAATSVAFAADLTLSGASRTFTAPASAQQRAKDAQAPARAGGDKRPALRKQDRKKAQQAQADRDRQHRILVYSLFQDPLSRLRAEAVERQPERFADTSGARTSPPITGLGYTAPLPVQAATNAVPSRFATLPAGQPDNTGIAFGCRERPFSNSMNRRELAACFRHNVDRSWKAQTYLSRGYTDGTQTWGGGLSVAYDY